MIALTAEEEKTKKSYNQFAASWHQNRGRVDFWKNEFKKFSSLAPVGSVIDVGCGSGLCSAGFTKAGYDYIGIDISRGLIEIANRENPGAEFIEMDMYDLFFPPDRFDSFWCAASLLHAPKGRVGLVLGQIMRVVKNNGVGFIAIMEGVGEGVQSLKDYGERFFARYSQAEFSAILRVGGFDIIESYPVVYKDITDKKRSIPWLVYFVKNKK